MSEDLAVVIDAGSANCRFGIADNETPTVAIPTMLSEDLLHSDFYVGDTGQKLRDLTHRCPIDRGVVTDWDILEALWRHVFDDKFRVRPENQPILVTVPPMTSYHQYEHFAQFLFESFNAPAIHIADASVLACNALGRHRCLLLHVGDGYSFTLPMYEYYAFSHAARRQDLAGRDVTDSLMTLLQSRNLHFSTASDRSVLQDIKKNVSDARSVIPKNDNEAVYTMPSGETISIGKERFQCTDILFQPKQAGIVGLPQLLFDTVMACDVDVRKDLWSTISISGGTMKMKGMAERILEEMRRIAPQWPIKRVYAQDDRELYPWIGGSIFAAPSMYQCKWVTRDDYEEWGPSSVLRCSS